MCYCYRIGSTYIYIIFLPRESPFIIFISFNTFRQSRTSCLEHGVNTPDGIAHLEIIKKIYESEIKQADRLLPKLTDLHFNHDTFYKMKVYPAVQLLSESSATATEIMVEKGFFRGSDIKKARATAKFCRNFNDLFDLMNAKNPNDVNEYKRGISKQNINKLKELKNYVDSIEQIQERKVFWIDGLRLTLNAVIGYCEENLKDTESILLTRFLNQDPLENLFGEIRKENANSQNPYLLDFLRILARIITTKIDLSSVERNCEWDQTSQLTLVNLSKVKENEVKDDKKVDIKKSDWIDLKEVRFLL